MWAHLKESLAELRRAAPGERFRRRYRDWRERRREPYVVTALYIVLGIAAIAVGIVFSFWPVVPGFVFVLAGLTLVGTRSEWAAHRLDRLELLCRRWLPRGWLERHKNSAARSAGGGRSGKGR